MKKFLISFIVIAIVFFNFSIPTTNAIEFGGRILASVPCTNGAYLIAVGLPRPGVFIYQPGISTLYKHWNIFTPGAWVLGNTFPSTGVCIIGAFPTFLPLINKIGTSLF